MKTLLMGTAAALFVAGTAYAADTVVIIDTDSDGMISADEFASARAEGKVFGALDANDDGFLSQDEYQAWVDTQPDVSSVATWDDRYASWDADSDSMLSADEWNTGLFDTFDEDDDGMFSTDEMSAFEADEEGFDATRVGKEVSPPSGGTGSDAAGATSGGGAGAGGAGAGGTGGAATQ